MKGGRARAPPRAAGDKGQAFSHAQENARLPLRQTGPHGEIGLRQKQRLGIIAGVLLHAGLSSRRIRQGKGCVYGPGHELTFPLPLWERVPSRRRSRARAGEGSALDRNSGPLTRLALRSRSALATLSHKGRGKRECRTSCARFPPACGNASPARFNASRACALSAAICALSVSTELSFSSGRIQPMKATSILSP